VSTSAASNSLLCPACGRPVAASDPFCAGCGRLQPIRPASYFEIFGLDRRLALDIEALERQFYRLSRRLHPDRFAASSNDEQQLSLAQSSRLNDAYRTLADAVRRAEYLLETEGVWQREQRRGGQGQPNGANGGAGADDATAGSVPAELLEEVFELNMALDEARSGLKAGGGLDEATRTTLEETRAGFLARMQQNEAELKRLFAAWDNSLPRGDRAALDSIGQTLDRRRYLRNLLRDINAVLGE
jgi:molecular chaperone HscB